MIHYDAYREKLWADKRLERAVTEVVGPGVVLIMLALAIFI